MRIHDYLMRVDGGNADAARGGGVIVVVVVCASLQIQLLSTKDKGRPWPQFIHDFEVNCSKRRKLASASGEQSK